LTTGEIAEDLTYYFATSEQIPTSVALGVLMNRDNTVRRAGGFIIQLMPFAEEPVIAALEERLKEFSSITSYLDRGVTPEQMMEVLFKDFDYTINRTLPTQFYCNCSKEHVAKAVISLGRNEIRSMIDDGEAITVNCQFCGSHYQYSIEELEEMLQRA
jgi:molecular chaperone Hsp33